MEILEFNCLTVNNLNEHTQIREIENIEIKNSEYVNIYNIDSMLQKGFRIYKKILKNFSYDGENSHCIYIFLDRKTLKVLKKILNSHLEAREKILYCTEIIKTTRQRKKEMTPYVGETKSMGDRKKGHLFDYAIENFQDYTGISNLSYNWTKGHVFAFEKFIINYIGLNNLLNIDLRSSLELKKLTNSD